MICSDCGKEMVKRKGKRGEFYGCSSYPECTHTAPITSSTGPVDEVGRRDAIKAYKSFVAAKGWTESMGSRWIQSTLGLNWEESRIQSFDKKQCELLVAYIKIENETGGESEMAAAFRRAKERKKK